MQPARPWWTEPEPLDGGPPPATTDADALIARLGLVQHPEGGWYRETFRDTPPAGGRGAVSQIYFLLKAGERSRWHRLDAAEIWHFYQGAAVSLSVHMAERGTRDIVLGVDFAAGQQAHAVVPAGAWQAAEPLGQGWALLGCTVAPAFRFEGFEMAPAGWRPGTRGTA